MFWVRAPTAPCHLTAHGHFSPAFFLLNGPITE